MELVAEPCLPRIPGLLAGSARTRSRERKQSVRLLATWAALQHSGSDPTVEATALAIGDEAVASGVRRALLLVVQLSSLGGLQRHARIDDKALVSGLRRPRTHAGATAVTPSSALLGSLILSGWVVEGELVEFDGLGADLAAAGPALEDRL